MSRFPVLLILLLAAPLSAFSQTPEKKQLSPAEAKAAFLKLLDRPKVPFDPKPMTPSVGVMSRMFESFTIATEKKPDGTIERMPVHITRPIDVPKPPKDGRWPVVIVLHGTGGNATEMGNWMRELANLGFMAVAIDARYHGDRVPGVKGSTAYVAAITKAWRTPVGQPQEHPFFYDTVWDLWRLLDYLETRPDVDKDRIGMIGVSMGGIQTYLAAAADDRVKVTCPLIAAQSFRWGLENDKWQGRAKTIWAAHEAAAKDLGDPAPNATNARTLWAKLIPGITDNFDGPNVLPLFVGRSLFLANGELDPNCPIEGAKLAADAARKAFAAAGASDKLEIQVAPGVAHKVTDGQRAACVAFCVKWLKP